MNPEQTYKRFVLRQRQTSGQGRMYSARAITTDPQQQTKRTGLRGPNAGAQGEFVHTAGTAPVFPVLFPRPSPIKFPMHFQKGPSMRVCSWTASICGAFSKLISEGCPTSPRGSNSTVSASCAHDRHLDFFWNCSLQHCHTLLLHWYMFSIRLPLLFLRAPSPPPLKPVTRVSVSPPVLLPCLA